MFQNLLKYTKSYIYCVYIVGMLLTFVMCEGCPVLLTVLHLLHYYQSPSLHVH